MERGLTRREVLVGVAAVGMGLALGVPALAGGKRVREWTLHDGFTWIMLNERPNAKVRKALRPYVVARLDQRASGGCAAIEVADADQAQVLAILAGGS